MLTRCYIMNEDEDTEDLFCELLFVSSSAHECVCLTLFKLQSSYQVLFTIPIFVSYTALEKAGGSEVPVVWWHLMPFATTTQHAPPVGFGDGHTYFSFAAKWKWGLAYKTVYELIYKDAVCACVWFYVVKDFGIISVYRMTVMIQIFGID